MKEYKYHYNYKITNLLTNKSYIGAHSSDNLEDNYMGSSKVLRKDIKLYGTINFKKEILKVCDTRREATYNEQFLIKEHKTLIPSGYNISETGGWYAPRTKVKIEYGNSFVDKADDFVDKYERTKHKRECLRKIDNMVGRTRTIYFELLNRIDIVMKGRIYSRKYYTSKKADYEDTNDMNDFDGFDWPKVKFNY